MKKMKHPMISLFGIGFLMLGVSQQPMAADNKQPPSDTLTGWEQILTHDFQDLRANYLEQRGPLVNRLGEIITSLHDPCTRNPESGYHLLWERMSIEDALKRLEDEHLLKMTKLRYRKGVEIVKMLYEKILSMDHHFSSLKAQQEMQKVSNPHNYPEFKELKATLDERLKRKFSFTTPAAFQTNPYLSAAFSIVGLVVIGLEDKKADLEKVACIMDFTVRIHQDMNVIFYETGYLREANITLKRDCESLFAECSRQVGYTIPLENCRNSDDWERLYALLDQLVNRALGELNPPGNMTVDPKLSDKTETNLQFAIDRILQFINRYTDFVYQGNEYYKKFSKITANYQAENPCAGIIPDQFHQIKTDIDQTLEKFNSAYRMPEVQGSKLKDMLYGNTD
jgi:hypothetical protein